MKQFLSTPSVGRATAKKKEILNSYLISIHALRGEGDDQARATFDDIYISIHALRGEGDFMRPAFFLFGIISIHALRGEGD